MKSKFVAALCILALFIPTYIAVFAYFSEKNAPLDTKKIDRMEIYDLRQNVFEYTADSSDGKQMIDFLLKLNAQAAEVPALPDQLMSSEFFKISFFAGNKEAIYKYYLSLSATESYFLDDKGTVYKIAAEDAAKLISFECAQSLYEASLPPVLLTAESTPILPKSVGWNYKNAADTFVPSAKLETAASVSAYTMHGGLELDFSVAPDLLTAKIYRGSELLYDGLYSDMTGLSITEQTTLNILLNAKWYEDASRDYFGEATYEFLANITAPASFHLGKTSMQPGEFTVLTGVNVTDVSKIKVSVNPAITHESKTFTPTFFADGKYVRALIPTTYESTVEKYELTIEYGAVKQTLSITMEPRTFGNSTLSPSTVILGKTRTPQTIAAFEQAMAPIAAAGDPTRYWDGLFVEAVKNGVIRTGYGRYRTITTNKEVYRHNGVDYGVNVGTNVLAINSGKVVYTGVFDYTGNIVVIEHGYGLKSWYAHLSNISVSVGDIVQKGDVIGKSGSSGFVEYPVLHVSLSVFDFPVCQYALWEEELDFLKD